jgi:hypothetical protein
VHDFAVWTLHDAAFNFGSEGLLIELNGARSVATD